MHGVSSSLVQRRKEHAFWILSILLALALTGCGGDDVGTGGRSPDSGSPSERSGPTDSGPTNSDPTDSGPANEARLRILRVSLTRVAQGATTCNLGVIIRNEGTGLAEGVSVEAEVETVSLPAYSAKPILQGPAQIAAGDERRYFSHISFPLRKGDLLKYDIVATTGGSTGDSATSNTGIECSG
jgi:hypothetical protein